MYDCFRPFTVFFAFPTSATRRRLRCVEVYVWFWEKIRVAVLRLERICVSESESAIGWDGKRAGTQQSCSSNSIFDHLKQVLVFVVIRRFLWKLAVREGG
jgi:hypothetical protein